MNSTSESQSIQHKLNCILILDFIKIVFKGNKAKHFCFVLFLEITKQTNKKPQNLDSSFYPKVEMYSSNIISTIK